MSSACTKERFMSDVASHKLAVLREDGIYRHLRFRKPGTSCMGFDILTWPGYLCYTGDMGTYVFQRLEDMLQFFRNDDKYGIDFRYWAEKVQAQDRDGVMKFSVDSFRENITRHFNDFAEEMPEGERATLWADVKSNVLNAGDYDENEVGLRDAARAFEYKGRPVFQDFWEVDCREFTFRFLWCCYALAWGIGQYDAREVAGSAR